jgi:hypothetical protein
MSNLHTRIKTYCFFMFTAFCLVAGASNTAQAYFNDFEGAVGSEWSSTSTDTTPLGGRNFLGQFGTETVSLTLASVPACTVTLSFELFLINSWDGNGDHCCGPDVIDVSVAGGTTLLHTTFANVPVSETEQAYPDEYPGGQNVARSGAAENNTLGYTFFGDSVYNLTFTFAHTGGDLVLNFSATGLQSLGDESWGLDNVLVNCAPDCSSAVPSVATLWPPNHKFVPITITGVTDADGDPLTITIDSIFQDEPVDAKGSGNTAPDGKGVGTDTAEVRSERSGSKKVPGNGRVYHIGFTADDGNGGTCSGTVKVCVPHDKSGDECVDDGPLYDSTAP